MAARQALPQPMALLFDTATLPPARRFDAWQELIGHSFLGMRAEPVEGGPLRSRVEMRDVAGIDVAAARFSPQKAYRGSRDIAGLDRDVYCLCLLTGGGASGAHRGVAYAARPGDLLVLDVAEPFETVVGGPGLDFLALQIDKARLASRLGAPPRDVPVLRSTREGPGALLAGFVEGLSRGAPALPAGLSGRAADILCDLFGLALTGEPEAEAGEGRLAAALAFIARNVADPGLGAARVAAHLGLSERSVYGLFERAGLSLAEAILAERLEACRRALRDPAQAGRTIADIALGTGFADLSRFNRRYRARFGETPRETRGRGRS